jgi:hypothetical protein
MVLKLFSKLAPAIAESVNALIQSVFSDRG